MHIKFCSPTVTYLFVLNNVTAHTAGEQITLSNAHVPFSLKSLGKVIVTKKPPNLTKTKIVAR